jgi:rsbT co-antagonist protein RsbR
MSSELEKFKAVLKTQKDELLAHIARLSMASKFDWEIPEPEEDSPLGDIIVAVRMAAENLDLIAAERESFTQELRDKIELIQRQNHAIMELSTPIIEVTDGVLLVPLIGKIDTLRAQRFTEKLLGGIESTRSPVAVIDITGLSAVDARTANHLFSAMRAAQMLGADVIITGVSPSNAMTLAEVGSEFNAMVFRGSLKEGLKWALKKRPMDERLMDDGTDAPAENE